MEASKGMSDTARQDGAEQRPRIGERVDQIGSDAQRLWEDTRAAAEDLGHTVDLRGRLERHPYGTLAVAFGVGYLLGGGLFTPATARVVRMGMKLAALPLVKDELLNLAEAVVDDVLGGSRGARVASVDDAGTTHDIPPAT